MALHKCELCNYFTKRSDNMNRHNLTNRHVKNLARKNLKLMESMKNNNKEINDSIILIIKNQYERIMKQRYVLELYNYATKLQLDLMILKMNLENID